MKFKRTPLFIAIVLILVGCSSPSRKIERSKPTTSVLSQSTSSSGGMEPVRRGGYYQDDGPGENPPANLDQTPDAQPRNEPLIARANRPYRVFGKQYIPDTREQPFTQKGTASWYGRKFHGQRTSSGEIYDMYAMTAAHPTLPIPSYVRVTNLKNGKSVMVRINDRGPFHAERIMDLSYVAAYKLGYLEQGSALVEVERIFPSEIERQTVSTLSPLKAVAFETDVKPNKDTPTDIAENTGASTFLGIYLQVGAFSLRENAEDQRAQIYKRLPWLEDPIQIEEQGQMYRLVAGPYPSRQAAEFVAQKITGALQIKAWILTR